MKILLMTETAKPDKWQILLGLYSEGASDAEIAKELDITIARFHQLCDENEAFGKFAEKGRTLAMAWWYKMGRVGLVMDKFSATLYGFNMKNRYGWADKVESNDTTNKDPVDINQLQGVLRNQLRKLAAKNPDMLRDLVDDE